MSARRVVVGALTGTTLALVASVACIAAGLARFAPGLEGLLLGIVATAAIGALTSLVVRRLEPTALAPWRLALVGAIVSALPFVLLHGRPLGFIGLNEVGAGAGPLGELVLATLPLLGAYAGACLSLFAAAPRPVDGPNEKAARSGERAA
ncbi:MAG: hypothetical protein JWM74_3626 [Myxococcaceae bacterium]|nr:hypothetical protein [Myxococcaceae bacterium]